MIKVRDMLYGLWLDRGIIKGSCSLYDKIISMRVWSNNFYQAKDYWVGYKFLQTAYKLANGYILQKSFIESDYKIQRRKFIKEFKKLTCDNIDCNIKYDRKSPLKPCVGCMKVQFCSKKCQKSHWNAGHHKDCDKGWENMGCSMLCVNNIGVEIKENIVDILIQDHCKKHDESTEDCMDCMSKSDIPFIRIIDYQDHINKLRNGDDIVAPKRVILKFDYGLKEPRFVEIKRSKELCRKEMVKTVCEICIYGYREASLAKVELKRMIPQMIIKNIQCQGNNVYYLGIQIPGSD